MSFDIACGALLGYASQTLWGTEILTATAVIHIVRRGTYVTASFPSYCEDDHEECTYFVNVMRSTIQASAMLGVNYAIHRYLGEAIPRVHAAIKAALAIYATEIIAFEVFHRDFYEFYGDTFPFLQINRQTIAAIVGTAVGCLSYYMQRL